MLTTYIPKKNECRLYIAYIGTKGTNRMNVGLLLIATERKTESTYKKKNLYIFIYRQKEKKGAKRAK